MLRVGRRVRVRSEEEEDEEDEGGGNGYESASSGRDVGYGS